MIKRILVAPLDWGLGHATRCIPIINYLLKKNIEVVIAADQRPLELLKKEFPLLEFVVMPGYEINYPKNGSMGLPMILSVPKILYGIRREHKMLDKIIEEKKIEAVISDNRYGLYNKSVPSVFITHQINIRSPFFGKFLNRINRQLINRHNKCWIPDFEEEENLSGELSHKQLFPKKYFFIGPLSRFNEFSLMHLERSNVFVYDLIFILSGPEPQRSIFETKMLEQLKITDLKVLIVRGITEVDEEIKISDNIKMVSNFNSEKLQLAIQQSKMVLARPGYSTIMDLATLGKRAIFIPTPGQTEQEYLSEYLMQKGVAYSIFEKDIDILTVLKKSEKYSGFKKLEDPDNYKKCIDHFLENI